MIKPVGGRGKVAPYSTTTMRVPKPIADKVQNLIESYRVSAMNGLVTQDNSKEFKPQQLEHILTSKFEAIEKAKEILSQKQSAKKSIIKLLQVLYGGEINL